RSAADARASLGIQDTWPAALFSRPPAEFLSIERCPGGGLFSRSASPPARDTAFDRRDTWLVRCERRRLHVVHPSCPRSPVYRSDPALRAAFAGQHERACGGSAELDADWRP